MAGWALERVIQRDPTFCRWAGEYYSRPAILAELLGGDPRQITADTPAARHGVMLWAQVATPTRRTCRETRTGTAPRIAPAQYLQHLQSLGYVLSDVEQMILDNAADERPTETSHGDQAPAGDDEHNPEVTAA